MDKSMIEFASGRALMDKTPVAARNLISNMASNTQNFGVRGRLENKITALTSLVRQLAIGQHHTSPPTKVCGICTSIEHPTNVCPTLQETEPNSAEVVGLISGPKGSTQTRDSILHKTYLITNTDSNHQFPNIKHHPSNNNNNNNQFSSITVHLLWKIW
ncbi:hypothetical protein CR513_42405, partial [Mucuna pruriens]